ncbi:general substrate transporter [Obba rivulosa]|uniref:General substrate transporter n=1 Tax=Obba rivulosa TaxID=1052685 RepID=A0A8E2ANJ0_9APHY|nr:general substrate transporter [Obba rivulosa]
MVKAAPHTVQGPRLVALITSVCSMGFWLFGYDQGVMSGVVVSPFWLAQMGHPSTVMVGTITALYDVGAVVGAIAAASTSEWLGRKRTLILGATVLIVGTVLMGSAMERVQMMVARVFTGIGIGYITSVTPVYQSEISLPEHRGWQVCCQLTSMLGGLMLAYWINYGLSAHASSLQWRFPLLFQCVFALYIIAVTVWLPDTPRWLMRHARHRTPQAAGEDEKTDEATEVLARLRALPVAHEVVQRERAEIAEAIELEAREEGSWTDLFKDHGIMGNKRFFLALGIQFMQQMTGINIVTYYAPTLFQSSLGMSEQMSLFLGCWLQVWYIIASFLTWFMIDRVGRRKLWISMALGQCLVLVLEGICVKLNTPSAGVGAVFLIFAFEACFTWGWMATVWVYPAEILPLKLRAKGAALAAGADFLGNFLVVEITPPALQNIGYKTYIIFAVLNFVNAVIVWAFYPETAGLTLESIDRLFRHDAGTPTPEDAQEQPRRFWEKMQWSAVSTAATAVERAKIERRARASGHDVSESSDISDAKGSREQIENVKEKSL